VHFQVASELLLERIDLVAADIAARLVNGGDFELDTVADFGVLRRKVDGLDCHFPDLCAPRL
jgi:hypothetical protein